MSQAHSADQSDLGPPGHRPRRRRPARGRGLQVHRHHHLHRLQGLRGRLRRMERHAVPARRRSTTPTRPCRTTAWNYWNLIKFNEHRARRRHAAVADAQGPVHALRGSRLPARLPGRRRHRPVHERHRRLPAGELHRLQYCVTAARSTSRSSTRRRRRSTSARSARTASAQGLEPACIKACPTGCLQFGTRTT